MQAHTITSYWQRLPTSAPPEKSGNLYLKNYFHMPTEKIFYNGNINYSKNKHSALITKCYSTCCVYEFLYYKMVHFISIYLPPGVTGNRNLVFSISSLPLHISLITRSHFLIAPPGIRHSVLHLASGGRRVRGAKMLNDLSLGPYPFTPMRCNNFSDCQIYPTLF